MSTTVQLGLATVALMLEGFCLYHGQRRLFWAVEGASGSRMLAYLAAAPGTILHEASHYVLCLILGVPAGDQVADGSGKRGHVTFFRPRKSEDGSITLGSVPHAATDPLRGALIAIAPVLLVPPLLAGLTVLLLGSNGISDLPSAFWDAGWWQKLLWLYLAFSCGQAAFPSPGDHIGFLGGIALLLLGSGVIYLIISTSGLAKLADLFVTAAAVGAVPAASAALTLLVLQPIANRRRQSAPAEE